MVKREFSTLFFPKNTNFDTPGKEWLMDESKSPVEKSHHTSRTITIINPRLYALKRVKETVSLYLHHPSCKVAQFSAKSDLLGSWFTPWGNVRVCEWVSGFPNYVDTAKGPLLSHPIQNTEECCTVLGRKGWEKRSQGSERASIEHGSY